MLADYSTVNTGQQKNNIKALSKIAHKIMVNLPLPKLFSGEAYKLSCLSFH